MIFKIWWWLFCSLKTLFGGLSTGNINLVFDFRTIYCTVLGLLPVDMFLTNGMIMHLISLDTLSV